MVEKNGDQEETGCEVCLVVPKRIVKEGDKGFDCIEFLVSKLEKVGLIVDRIPGFSDEFIKLAAHLETLGRAATELQIWRLWCERFQCFHYLIYGIVNETESDLTLRSDTKVFKWETGESLLKKMKSEGIVLDIFPLHDETMRKRLLRSWAYNWLDFTWQPIDEIYLYYGTKIAIYFSFLGMYTKWLSCPAVFGLALHLIDFGSWQLLVLPVFSIFTISWVALFLQFWKRKNAALLTRWQISYSVALEPRDKDLDTKKSLVFQLHEDPRKETMAEKAKERDKIFPSEEWLGRLMRFRNEAIVVLGIICLQLPFELAYAHLYEVSMSEIMKFGLTTMYLLIIQYYIRVCGKILVKLIKYEHNKTT